MLSFINSLPEEPVSEDLEEAAIDYATKEAVKDIKGNWNTTDILNAFRAAAQWQKEQMMKDALDLKINRDTLYDLKPIIHEKYLDYRIGDRVKVKSLKTNSYENR